MLAEQGAPEWTVIASEVQTRGRGRADRSWKSPKGGLWFSVILKPKILASKVWILQFLAANAAREAIETETRMRVLVKWPNDLVAQGEKLGGILVETKTMGENVAFAVIGIGINANLAKRELPTWATSIYASKKKTTPLGKLLDSILQKLQSEYPGVSQPYRVLEDWWLHCAHRSTTVQVALPTGQITGVAEGIDSEGRLIVRTQEGSREKISEGTLRFPTG